MCGDFIHSQESEVIDHGREHYTDHERHDGQHRREVMLPLFHDAQSLFVIADVLVESQKRDSEVLQLDADLAKRIDEAVDAFVIGHGGRPCGECGVGNTEWRLLTVGEALGDNGDGLGGNEVLVVLAGGEEGLQVGGTVGL